jgi:hypothetical protein
MGGIRHKFHAWNKAHHIHKVDTLPLLLKQAYFRIQMRPCFTAVVSKFT